VQAVLPDMTSLSSFLPHKTVVRPCAAKLSSASSTSILFPAHGKSQLLFAGSNGSARLAQSKPQVARAAAICIAQVEEAAQGSPFTKSFLVAIWLSLDVNSTNGCVLNVVSQYSMKLCKFERILQWWLGCECGRCPPRCHR
jgi:hypothetical protein